MVQVGKDQIEYKSRAENGVSLEEINVKEKDRFMNDEKVIAFIFDASSVGMSLHSCINPKNKRRRVHITLELPWSAEKAIQQFGRTHRSNQQIAPHYIWLISDLAGEKRFAASLPKRLESLGALTHADRRAKETSNFSQYNIDHQFGREVLQKCFEKRPGRGWWRRSPKYSKSADQHRYRERNDRNHYIISLSESDFGNASGFTKPSLRALHK